MAQTADPKSYYGYLFQPDKKPTPTLEALLRGIANYITESVGSKDEKCLTPTKLAAFYKAVGGNYDSLFVDVPHPSLSWIYASIGCQHTLQPSADDFTPPSVPALTPRGYVQWQSIEILLGPEEHVLYLQNAVRNFAIKNPETGERFPIDLPAQAFPAKADAEITEWHNTCARKLRQQATPNEEEDEAPHLPARPEVQGRFAHVRPGRPRAATDYFEPKSRSRPIPFQHVSSADARPVRPRLSRSPTTRARQFLAPEDHEPPISRSRRRSYPENINSSPEIVEPPRGAFPPPPPGPPPPFNAQFDPRSHAEERVRRHSHSQQPHYRRRSVSSSASSSSSEADPPSPTSRVPIVEVEEQPPRRRSHPPHAHSHSDHDHSSHSSHRPHSHTHAHSDRERDHAQRLRFAPPPSSPRPRSPEPSRSSRRERARDRERERESEPKRRSFPLPIPVDLSGKLSRPFMLGRREGDSAAGSRSNSRGGSGGGGGNNVRWKDLYGADAGWRGTPRASDEDISAPPQQQGRRLSRDEREGDGEPSHGPTRRREREKDLRPRSIHSRRSSHEDVARRSTERERGGQRERDREEKRARSSYREREREDVETRRRGGSFRERRGMSPPPPPLQSQVRVVDGRRSGSPVRGVDGRRYPSG